MTACVSVAKVCGCGWHDAGERQRPDTDGPQAKGGLEPLDIPAQPQRVPTAPLPQGERDTG